MLPLSPPTGAVPDLPEHQGGHGGLPDVRAAGGLERGLRAAARRLEPPLVRQRPPPETCTLKRYDTVKYTTDSI